MYCSIRDWMAFLCLKFLGGKMSLKETIDTLRANVARLEAREAVHVKALELIADKHGDWTEAFMRQKARTALKQAGEIK
jgi:hypothetical protein